MSEVRNKTHERKGSEEEKTESQLSSLQVMWGYLSEKTRLLKATSQES